MSNKRKVLFCLSALVLIGSIAFAFTSQQYQRSGVRDKTVTFVYNASGAPLVNGDVVVRDYTATGDTKGMAVTTTTTADNSRVLGVVCESIDTASYGLVQIHGYHSAVKLAAADTPYLYNPYVSTGTTAKTCGACAGIWGPGILGEYVGDTPTNATTIPVWIFMH